MAPVGQTWKIKSKRQKNTVLLYCTLNGLIKQFCFHCFPPYHIQVCFFIFHITVKANIALLILFVPFGLFRYD